MVVDAYGSDPIPTGSRRGMVSGSFFHVIAAVAMTHSPPSFDAAFRESRLETLIAWRRDVRRFRAPAGAVRR